MTLGDLPRARALLEGVLERDPQSFAARYRLGALMVDESPREAMRELEEAASRRARSPGPARIRRAGPLSAERFRGRGARIARGMDLGPRPRRILAARHVGGGAQGSRSDRPGAVRGGGGRVRRGPGRGFLPGGRMGSLRDGLAPRWSRGAGGAGGAARARSRAGPPRRAGAPGVRVDRAGEARRGAPRTRSGPRRPSGSGRGAVTNSGWRWARTNDYRDSALALWSAVLEDPTVPAYHQALGQILTRMDAVEVGTNSLQHAEWVKVFFDRQFGRGAFRRTR